MSLTLTRRGILFVVSAPSGGGKSAVLERLLGRIEEFAYSVSVTSRAPRPGEKDGKNYHFVTDDEFRRMIGLNEFYEWAEVHGNYYGTRKSVVEEVLAAGNDLVMDIDVQGACQVKSKKPDAVTIFLLPPSMAMLEKRLRGRHSDDEEAIQLRLRNAATEIAQHGLFDYVIVNDDLDRTVAALREVIFAERRRGSRQLLVVRDEPSVEAAIRGAS